nr:MAG TPA: hypothetical protein [Caudoviricetes sp.]
MAASYLSVRLSTVRVINSVYADAFRQTFLWLHISQRVQLSMVIVFSFQRKRGRHVSDVQILSAKYALQSQANDVQHPNYYKYAKRSIGQIQNRRSNCQHNFTSFPGVIRKNQLTMNRPIDCCIMGAKPNELSNIRARNNERFGLKYRKVSF